MRWTAVACLLSALAGGLLAWALSARGQSQPHAPPIHLAQNQVITGARSQLFAQPSQSGTYSPSNPPGGTATIALEQTVSPWEQFLPPVGQYSPEELINIGVYERANKGVVNIRTKSIQGSAFFFMDVIAEGEGSGSVIDRQGHILTNYHVVENAQAISVTLFDGMAYDAQLVGADPPSDIAVLKIDAPSDKLFPVVFGDSTDLKVGQRVFAIGNPFGLERTLTTGIISSLNRSLPNPRTKRTLKQMIQIDAAINPGNSGGPLLDSHGLMIGMNTAIASRTGESAGVGFAIPVNTIARVVPQLIRTGRVIRADAGILQVLETDQGVLLAVLKPGGAAERAGLQGFRIVKRTRRQGPLVFESTTIDRSTADLVIAIDGKPVKTVDDMLSILDTKRPGETAIFRIIRQGRTLDVPVQLDAEQ
ncbi:MAG: trypsin-like peptidase domain-containing protein [Thermogutta sp.]|uniref:S1C family serine protease n=1 Tax=Thermogutta sp. TaxID=1962930 RepID=UPI0019A735A8|nr:trypsin-like peptidase domain-containing protein [Thermogutta sp.]MBC7352730.1 trypsin-like peptidase domain-containing protein [Thermogutta sp.]